MNILLLGSEGFFGSQLASRLQQVSGIKIFKYHRGALNGRPFRYPVSSSDFLHYLMAKARPDLVINCLVVKEVCEDSDIGIRQMYSVNAILPHQLAVTAKNYGARVIQISTDAVFSGAKGSYREDSLPDPKGDYAKSKFLGELHDRHTLTIRCSIIGCHQARPQFMDWVIKNEETLYGYKNYNFSPITCDFLIEVIIDHFLYQFKHTGILHIGSSGITKFDLINLIASHVNNNVEVIETDTPHIDRSLKSKFLKRNLGITVPDIREMVIENLRINSEI